MDQHCDTVVIGAGVIGLAIAKTLTDAGQKLILVEREVKIGSGTSSRCFVIISTSTF
jgi:L-2-hydroxyglutarate oxidase LhgO